MFKETIATQQYKELWTKSVKFIPSEAWKKVGTKEKVRNQNPFLKLFHFGYKM